MREHKRSPEISLVAIIALEGRDEMTITFSCCLYAVVASRTRTRHSVVIEIGGYPCIRRVAVVTLCIRLNVALILAGGNHAVVAACTGPRLDTAVIKDGGYPSVRCMAIVTQPIGLNMVLALTRRDVAIMANGAAPQDLQMINTNNGVPATGVVAVLANIGGIDVAGALACGLNTVMAADATTRDVLMIEKCRKPARRAMARVALLCGNRMIGGGFAGGCPAIVATGATSNDLRVIHGPDRGPGRFGMTVLALSGACNVIERQWRGLNKTAAGMAGGASPRRPFEHSCNVTALAAHSPVCAFKRKAGGEMIKI